VFLVLISRVRLASFVIILSNMFEILCILQLFLISHKEYWGWLSWASYYPSFFDIHFYFMASSNFS
jgi:hypothetical protein